MLEMEEQFMIRHLRDEGLSKSAISRETGYDRKTIRKYLLTGEIKNYTSRKPAESILDPYKDHIETRLHNFERLSATVLLKEIQEKGYLGGYSTVKKFVRTIKRSKRVNAEYRYETGPGVQSQVDWSYIDTIEIDEEKRDLYCLY